MAGPHLCLIRRITEYLIEIFKRYMIILRVCTEAANVYLERLILCTHAPYVRKVRFVEFWYKLLDGN